MRERHGSDITVTAVERESACARPGVSR